jgi:hypothetical protein
VSPAGPRFSLRGSRNGSLVTLAWSPGELAGDPPTVDLVLAELEIARACADNDEDTFRDSGLTALVAGAGEDPLADPDTAYALAERVLDAVREIEAHPTELAERLQARRAARPEARA